MTRDAAARTHDELVEPVRRHPGRRRASGAVHFVGVGGAGMSGIARIMLARGIRVSGCDAKDVPRLAALRALGAAGRRRPRRRRTSATPTRS